MLFIVFRAVSYYAMQKMTVGHLAPHALAVSHSEAPRSIMYRIQLSLVLIHKKIRVLVKEEAGC